jgi:hypothetical protein
MATCDVRVSKVKPFVPEMGSEAKASPHVNCCVLLNPLTHSKNYVLHALVFRTSAFCRMPSSGMWHHAVLVNIDVSEERAVSIFRVKEIT